MRLYNDGHGAKVKGNTGITMRDHYSIADAKLAAIVEAIDLPRERLTQGAVREFILADRIGRVEYQRWLDTAPAELIAAWVTAKLRRPVTSGVGE